MAKNIGAGCAPWLVLGVVVVMIGRCIGGDGSSTPSNSTYVAGSVPEPPVATAHRYTQADTLNCREVPTTSGRRVESLSRGTFVGVIRTESGWSLLDRPTPCWATSSYLGEERPLARPARLYGGGGSERRSGGSRRSSGWSYANCSAARAAGADPVYAGEPGYAPHLDRDGDGVGCE